MRFCDLPVSLPGIPVVRQGFERKLGSLGPPLMDVEAITEGSRKLSLEV